MPLSDTLKNLADAVIASVVNQLATLQSTYKEANEKYWQGVAPVENIPADGNTELVDTSKKPTDQAEDWVHIQETTPGNYEGVVLASAIPVCVEVHTYDGLKGKGYVVIGTVVEDAVTYTRNVNIGSEEQREQAWTELQKEDNR